MSKIKVAIIGGGASGLFAASMLGKDNIEVCIFEKNNKLGKKILASGNGKCNFTNVGDYIDKYNSDFANKIVDKFSVKSTLNEFSKMGLVYKEDDQGRCYPVSESATSVLECLKLNLNNVTIKLECLVKNIDINKNRVCVEYNNESDFFDYVICCSGSSASNLGSEKAYNYLNDLGVKITPIRSSLTPIVVKEDVKSLFGVRVKCLMNLMDSKNNVVYSEKGEIVFKENGLSGIAIFNATSYINRKLDKYKISLDLSCDMKEKELISYFKNKKTNNLFTGFLNDKLALYIYKRCEVDKYSHLDDQLVLKIVKIIKNLQFNLIELYPLKDSQVCSGGVSINEVDDNLKLKKYPSIYVAGELLDVDGVCGGYNLQFAWSSGAVIAKDILNRIKNM